MARSEDTPSTPVRTIVRAESTEPARLPKPPALISRVDTLPEDFIKLLERRPLFIGDVLAERYKLLETLGEGAMGHVFIAENLTINRRVALKVLKPELLADASFRQRFQHEADAIGAIEHRNVARFLDLVVGDPTFLVMEYVRGPTLERVLKSESRLAIRRAVSIARRLAWALETAHRAGVVHRDIKPANVILSPDEEMGEEPKLIDFGLAKLATTTTAQNLTRTGQIIGTPSYMSPEQIKGLELDGRADVYALGCLLYEMVAGRSPFAGVDDVQVLYQQIHDRPPALETYVKGAPPLLERILQRALEKNPEGRYQSMRQLAEALGALSEALEQTQRGRGTDRRGLAVVAAAALVGGITLGALAARYNRGSHGGATALVLDSRPSGAQVSIDGVTLDEPTPTLVRDIPPGAHAVKLTKDKLAAVERQLTISPGERTLLSVVLPPLSHRLVVHSTPEGATVYLDGRRLGDTPAALDVTDDDFHELRVEKVGYESLRRALTPDDREPQLTLSLEPARLPRATLVVDSNSAAEVWIDGLDTGYTTPTLGILVPTGAHTVEVRDGAARAQAKVTLHQGQTLRLLLSPTR